MKEEDLRPSLRSRRSASRTLIALLSLLITSPGVSAQVVVSQPTPGVPQPPGRTGPRDPAKNPETGTAGIRGRVVGGENGGPLRRALVRLHGEAMREGRATTTDENGRYEFNDLPAGRYNVSAHKGGYVGMQFGQRRPFESGRPLEMSDGQVMSGVDFTLPRGGVITGRVTDEFGEPVADLSVKVMRQRYIDGRRQLLPMGMWARTDDLGRYRAHSLAPGDYYVNASSEGGMMMGAQTESRSGFAPTYYPGTPSVAEAQRVRVTVGTEVTANFALVTARTLRVTGTVTDSQGRPVSQGFVMVQEGQSRGFFSMGGGGMIKPDGSFTIGNLAAGDYVLHVTIEPRSSSGFSRGDEEFASVPISLGGDDLTDLAIVTSRSTPIAGQVVFDGGQPAGIRPGDVSFFLAAANLVSPMAGTMATPKDDWTFEAQVREAPVLLRARTPDGWSLRAVLQGGVDVTDSGIQFRPGEQIDDVQVLLSGRSSRISGTAVDARGVPAREYTVIVYVDDPARWGPMSRYLATARPDQQGRFEMTKLPPGTYLAVALDYLEDGQGSDPEFLQQMRPYATPIQLGDGEHKDIKLQVVAER
jgi:protocatechuate 3,4-dioxygenase beta subunit